MSVQLDNVFLAEDDLDDVDFFTEIVGEFVPPKKLQIAYDGFEFMELLYSAPVKPSIIFLDLNMPRKTGLECLQEIKADSDFDNIPVVMISTAIASDGIERSFEQGAHYYMVKPGSYTQFRKSINKIFATDFGTPLSRQEFLIRN